MIIREVLQPDEQLPSVRTLAKQLTINPNTIQKAYHELENQGYIYSILGKGSFVSPLTPNLNSEKLKALEKELVKIISEMMFLGLKKEDIMVIVHQAGNIVRGGEAGAGNKERE